jgi:hypothetical protein
MTGRRWYLIHGLRRITVAELSLRVPVATVKHVAQMMANELGYALEVMSGSPTDARLRVHNPSLAAHTGKPARWHIVSDSWAPLADLYLGTQADANKVGRLLANQTRESVRVLGNDQPLVPELKAHRRAGFTSPNPSRRSPKRKGPKAAGWVLTRMAEGYGRVFISTRITHGGRSDEMFTTDPTEAKVWRTRGEADAAARRAKGVWAFGWTWKAARGGPTPARAARNPGYWKTGDRFRLLMDVPPFNRHEHKKGETGTVTYGNPTSDSMIQVAFDSTPHVHPEAIAAHWAEKIAGNRRRSPNPKGRKNPLKGNRWLYVALDNHGKQTTVGELWPGISERDAKQVEGMLSRSIGKPITRGWTDVRVNPHGRSPNQKRRNPRSASERARGIQTFKKWHDFSPHRVTRVKAPSRIPRTMVKLGELEAIVYRSDKWAGGPDNPKGKHILYEHTTQRPRPMLATDPDGRDVFIVGGKMRVTADGLVH